MLQRVFVLLECAKRINRAPTWILKRSKVLSTGNNTRSHSKLRGHFVKNSLFPEEATSGNAQVEQLLI
jgi:hypothetical protein